MGVKALATEMIEVEADWSHENSVEGLLSTTQRGKTIAARPTIERSSITPSVVMVENSRGIFQFIEPKEKVFVT